MRTTLPAILLLALVLAACGDREQNETRLFLDRVSRVHIDAPPAERRRHIEALEAIALRTESLDDLRDVCVEGHSALVEAEEQRDEASRRLDELSGGDPDAQLEPGQARAIVEAIEASGAAIERARDKLTECQDRTAELERTH